MPELSTVGDKVIAISTDGVQPKERAEFWADLVTRHVTPMRIEPSGEGALRGEIQAHPLGQIGIARVSGSGVHALHTRSQVAQASRHVYAACVHLGGDARIYRNAQEIPLNTGDVFITDSRDEFALDLVKPWRHLVLNLPTELLDSRVARPELIAGSVLRNHPLVRLWATQLLSGYELAPQFPTASRALFARQSIELLAQLLEEYHYDRPTQSEGWRAALYVSACRVIALRYGDPDLRPEHVADALNVSSRTLARVFAINNTSIMRTVFGERVRQAANLLIDPQSSRRSVTEIAFACGFNDASHFGRVFTARMGMPPAQWRRRNS